MSHPAVFILLHIICISCNNNTTPVLPVIAMQKPPVNINPYAAINKIPLPEGYTRDTASESSFTHYLRNMGLKKDQTVYLYNGQPKLNQTAQFALLNISTGNTDLQQCADAVMRLRAEYLFQQKEYSRIVFTDNNRAVYALTLPYTRDHFDKYLKRVFGMCGSASLAKQLKPVATFAAIAPGDVLIRGGFPGHAVIVMDVAVNPGGKKIYLLAQSYMPAQDIHVLVNPINSDLSPWYEVNDEIFIQTPEYTFRQQELMSW